MGGASTDSFLEISVKSACLKMGDTKLLYLNWTIGKTLNRLNKVIQQCFQRSFYINSTRYAKDIRGGVDL